MDLLQGADTGFVLVLGGICSEIPYFISQERGPLANGARPEQAAALAGRRRPPILTDDFGKQKRPQQV